METTVSDLDFLETLSAHRCILLPPWVVQTSPHGGLTRVTRLVYDDVGNLNKPAILLQTLKSLRRARQTAPAFGGRFST